MLSLQPWLQAAALLVAYGLFTLWCYRQPLRRWLHRQRTTSTLVAYASETGQAARLARQLQQQLQQQGDQVSCLPLNQLSAGHLQQVRQLLLVVSTSGDGDAPDNGRLFLPRIVRTTPAPHWPHLQFAVLALGDRQYPHFCAFGQHLQQQLQQRGAQPLFAPVLTDNLDAQALQHWQQQLQHSGVLLQATQPEPVAEPISTYALSLSKRQWLNPGSPGAGLYELEFQCEPLPHWQAGDIARLHCGSQIREYSIASLPEEGCLRLLVREQHQPDGTPGLGSGRLCHGLDIGDRADFSIRSNPAFHAPDPDRPLILIGNGTGLAGLRAHLRQRELTGSPHNWLIYGERSPAHDRPWHYQLSEWLHSGHLHHLDLAFSRHTEQHWPDHLQGRCQHGYVQQVVQQHGHDLRQWLENGAVIYLCGSRAGMGQGVEEALTAVLGEQGLQRLMEQGRYCRDVY